MGDNLACCLVKWKGIEGRYVLVSSFFLLVGDEVRFLDLERDIFLKDERIFLANCIGYGRLGETVTLKVQGYPKNPVLLIDSQTMFIS